MKNPFILRLCAALALLTVALSHAKAADPLADLDNILQFRENKRNSDVIFACETYLNSHPDSAADATVRFYLAKALYDDKKYADSIEAVDALLRRHPKTDLLEVAVMLKGEGFRLQRKYAEMIPVFRQARELAHLHRGDNAAHAQYHVIQGLQYGKKMDEAKAELEKLKKDYPDSSYVRTATTLLNRKPATATTSRPETGPKVGSTAPDIEFISLMDGSTGKLSDLKGRVIALEFWASWCGPCQAPMAKMQTYRTKHPEWGDKVELLAVSIDNTKDAALKHLKLKGWNNTQNAWAGDGGFKSKPAAAYGVRGIPSMFIIDADGKVSHKGHPMRLDTPKLIDTLLGK